MPVVSFVVAIGVVFFTRLSRIPAIIGITEIRAARGGGRLNAPLILTKPSLRLLRHEIGISTLRVPSGDNVRPAIQQGALPDAVG
jgi:hypothetical protein